MDIRAFVKNDNAIEAAQYLLSTDKEAILPMYRQDAHNWVSALKNALERCEAHLNNLNQDKEKTSLETRSLILQQALQSLTGNVVNLASILTEEAKIELVRQL